MISASISIRLGERSSSILSLTDLFQKFENEGWSYINNKGEVVVLPLGDDGEYNWTSVAVNTDGLIDLFKDKRTRNEIIGIELMRTDSEVGCEQLL